MVATADRLVYRPVTGRVLTLCYAAFAVWWLVAGLAHGGRAAASWTAVAWLLLVGAVMHAVLWRPAVVVDADGVLLRNVLRDIRVPWAALEAVETRYALTLITTRRRYASWAAGAPGRGRALAGPANGGAGSAGPTGSSGGLTGGAGPTGGAGSTRSAAAAGSTGSVAGRTAGAADAAHLPRKGWLSGGLNPDRSSRDLRSDSGAAAFMVEQAWVGWRERPGARAEVAVPVPPVGVRWNLPVLAGVPVLLALALLAGAAGL